MEYASCLNSAPQILFKKSSGFSHQQCCQADRFDRKPKHLRWVVKVVSRPWFISEGTCACGAQSFHVTWAASQHNECPAGITAAKRNSDQLKWSERIKQKTVYPGSTSWLQNYSRGMKLDPSKSLASATVLAELLIVSLEKSDAIHIGILCLFKRENENHCHPLTFRVQSNAFCTSNKLLTCTETRAGTNCPPVMGKPQFPSSQDYHSTYVNLDTH